MAADVDLTRHLRPGDSVVVGQATGEPRSLVEALIEQRHALAPLRVFVGASYTGLFRPEHADALSFVSYGAVGRTAALAAAGALTILPIHVGSLPALIASGRVTVDAVLVQTSPPDTDGTCSLGLITDYLPAALDRARVAIAEVNPRVPYTTGDAAVPVERFAATVDDDRPLIEVGRRAPIPEDDAIGRLVAALIPDGATLQFGIGATPDAVLGHLGAKADLGVHSGLVSDALVDLVETGVVTNARKEIDRGVTVTGALMGTDRLYRWADRNRALAMRSLDHTHQAAILGRLPTLHAINSAVEVDLTGQVNGETADGRYVGTVGGQGAFARAASTSAHGRSIIALPSTARDGTRSRIVHRLSGAVVSTARADTDLVVTEHGVADLRGASLDERVARLIAIADPSHQDDLERIVGQVPPPGELMNPW